MSVETADLNKHLEQYKESGYTVFERVYDHATMAVWKETFFRLMEEHEGQTWFGNMCELEPDLMMPAVANPLILDFTELVMGPFVQLDNLTLAGFRSVEKEAVQGKVSGWHRDRWASMPTSADYIAPQSVNAISYFQDLTDEYGPLRVIPGTHRRPLTMREDELNVPHAEELVLHVKAGDVVFTHSGLVHSGTPNTSGDTRMFFSVYYNKSWLKHTDSHSGPNTQRLIQEARERNDHRMLRLFGIDEQLQKRANSGFMQPDELRWEQWAEADRKALNQKD